MNRDLARLSSVEFDLLVVGGGIYGLATAYDAAQRGLRVALVERGDFGSATSFNHLKTIHGGLRYLQTVDLTRMRESIRERRSFARIAPRFVAPLAFVMPTSSALTRNQWTMRAAFAIDASLGSDRNDGLAPAHRLPAGRIISAEECRALATGPEGCHAHGALWYDYQTVDGDRLTLAFALAAAAQGATLANYVEAALPLTSGAAISGIRARDILTASVFDIRARLTVNAAGPWTSELLERSGINRAWPLIKAMNLVTSRPARKAALVAPTKTGRSLILLPWRGRTLVGTSESSDEHRAGDQNARHAEVGVFLDEIHDTFPGFELQKSEITLVHRGIVPARKDNGRLALAGQSEILDHAGDGFSGLVSIVGVKYTTARFVAAQVVDLALKKLGRPAVPCRTGETILPTAGPDDVWPADRIRHAVETEMAHTLTDVIVRRTGLGAAGHPGDAIVSECGSAMRRICGWSEGRLASEVSALKEFYEIG